VLPAQTPANSGSLAWLSGHWCSATADTRIEELWLPPHGGVLLGLGRSLEGPRTAGFEFMRIAEVDSVPTFFGQPNGVPPTAFRRTAGGADWIRFENPEHDFPTRVEYRRVGKSALHAEVAGPGAGGKEQVIAYDYQLCSR
jgi:hypothetical protein